MESWSSPFSFDIAGRNAKHRENKFYATANRAATLVIDAYNYYENRTTSNLIRLFGDAAILASGPVGSAIYGLLDISGINNKVYDFLGNGADKSIEKIRDMYNSINQAGNPINYIPNF